MFDVHINGNLVASFQHVIDAELFFKREVERTLNPFSSEKYYNREIELKLPDKTTKSIYFNFIENTYTENA